MKTALNELIEGLKKDEITSQYAMERVSIRNCIIFATSLLETEKQQIIDAYDDGRYHGQSRFENSNDYFEQVFETNK